MKKVMLMCVLCLIACVQVKGQTRENLQVAWPGEYNWKVASNQQNAAMSLIELIPGKETLNNWSLMATMASYKNMRVPNISKIPALMFANMQKNAPKARLAILETGTKSNRQWALFKIESPSFRNSATPESQLYYAIQGDRTVYVSFVAVKTNWLSAPFVSKWAPVFKSSQIVVK